MVEEGPVTLRRSQYIDNYTHYRDVPRGDLNHVF